MSKSPPMENSLSTSYTYLSEYSNQVPWLQETLVTRYFMTFISQNVKVWSQVNGDSGYIYMYTSNFILFQNENKSGTRVGGNSGKHKNMSLIRYQFNIYSK